MKLILLELNEINFDFVRKYIRSGEKLPGFTKLLEGKFIHTNSEEKYEYLEPWIQWVSVHTGKSYKDHKIFRLGDIVSSSEKQIFETLEEEGITVGAVSPMNARNNLKKPSYFIPDPWTKTSNDGSLISRFIHQSIAQAVNDNAKSKLTKKTIFYFVMSMLIAIPLKKLFRLSFYALSCFKYKYRKALFLDIVIFGVHQYLFKKKNPDFSTLFLNGGAHIQHHYFFNSKIYKDSENKNPNWYLEGEVDPLLDMLRCYDKMITELLSTDNVEILVATGLSQKPYDRTKFYYRLENHKKFLKHLGISYKEVLPRMTRDFLIKFGSSTDAEKAHRQLKSLKINDEVNMFNHIDNRGKELFVTLTYPNEILNTDFVRISDGKKMILKDQVVFVAIKNGMHQAQGFAYFSDGIKNFAPSDGDHVKEIYFSILKFFGITVQ